ncbi:MAG TPA: phosphoglycerate mutase family protein [Flavisolibacter sp.]|nr:phosphoglycerate mutase family protein [Flavisolibacter sp.]
MRISNLLLLLLLLPSCKSASYFVVRHAEKETTVTMGSDVPLSAQGKERAEALKDLLISSHIRSVYATNFLRTRSTAQPLTDALNLPIQVYEPLDTNLVKMLRNRNENILIVGHSNTVDNIVNTLMGSVVIPGDLKESQYGDLFVVKRKGKHYSFEKKHFGK